MRGRQAKPLPRQDGYKATALNDALADERRQAKKLAHADGDGWESEETTLKPGAVTKIRHGLGRKPRGWMFIAGPEVAGGLGLTVPICAVKQKNASAELHLFNGNAEPVSVRVYVF